MGRAARAIIFKDDKILVMHRNKYGSQYFTLVGGRINEDESIEDGLIREVKEETGLDISYARLVFVEHHPAPYNEQYIFLCEVASTEVIELQKDSEEHLMNKLDMNTHTPMLVDKSAFAKIPFRTIELQTHIANGLNNGFPDKPIKI
jgi:ADP-ribose pyrophosphatase YjhB (NUDIX family)